ncbi:MAG: hypothetical protein QOJ94_1419 [Sphingomonadales bacterium]|jgi:hypothetical protein|nr:hypothetical protein [Sphingomonadales bacterium]
MDEASLPLSNRALWAALREMHLPAPRGASSFETALSKATGWRPAFAGRAIAEYRRFLFLAATCGGELTPSHAVDQVWHLHLDLPHYEETLCGRILGRPLHHRPGTGDPADERRFRRQYLATLRLYQDVFADPPPPDVWPGAREGGRSAARPRPSPWRRLYHFRILLPAALWAGAAAAAAAGSDETAFALLFAGFVTLAFLFAVQRPSPDLARAAGGCDGVSGWIPGDGSHGHHGHAACGGHGGHSGCGGHGCGGGGH